MEVHAHAHSPAAGGTGRKNWTHYFWEFLMLFLAVFCGFLAENIREHKVEKEREKQYISSLVNDLKSDIAQLDSLDREWLDEYNTTDTLLRYLAGKEILTDSRPAFSLINRSTGFTDFVSNDGTLQQLMNNGGLRLLRKTKVTEGIMGYKKTVDRVSIKQQGMNDAQIKLDVIIDLFDVIRLSNSSAVQAIPLLNTDKRSLNSAYTYILMWRREFNALRRVGKDAKESAGRLLKAIEEEYKIK